MLEDCSGCVPGYFTDDFLLTSEVVFHQCAYSELYNICLGLDTLHTGLGKDDEGRVCHSRGVCWDDHRAWQQVPFELNRLQRGSYRGNGSCRCGDFFSGPDCSVGECPPGYEYAWDHLVDHFNCRRCQPGTFKATKTGCLFAVFTVFLYGLYSIYLFTDCHHEFRGISDLFLAAGLLASFLCFLKGVSKGVESYDMLLAMISDSYTRGDGRTLVLEVGQERLRDFWQELWRIYIRV
eukprot:s303_g13.t1